MAIEATDIKAYLSGGSSNTDPNLALGGEISTTEYTGGTVHDLFDVISGEQNQSETTDYRCIYIVNEHGTLTWEDVQAWFLSTVSGGATANLGLDPAGVNGTATTIADENTAPNGVSFSKPVSQGEALNIGNIPAGEHQAIWIRRTATDSGAMNNDGATIRFRGSSEAE